MKFLITLCFISISSNAATLGQFISKPEGSSFQQFKISSGKIVYEKQSNFFDKNNDLRLGQFSSDYKISDKEQKKMDSMLSKIKNVDEFLKKKNSSFNNLSLKKPHESFIVFDDYRISKESDLYPELKGIVDNLLKQNWIQDSGIRLTDDYKSLIHIKNGKEVSRESFNFPFHCQRPAPPTQCMFRDYGVLYLLK